MIIAIDGPSGTGKSTVAQRLARKLNFFYFDTGAMYRCFAYFLLKRQVDAEDQEGILQALKAFDFDVELLEGEYHYFIEGEDISLSIRQERVSEMASKVAKHGFVRESLLPIQRAFGLKGHVVMEGRDIGTVIFPQAELKIFLTADLKVRTERRLRQLEQKFGATAEYDRVLEEMEKRDRQDSNRNVAPLKQAEDAVVIDTTHFTIDEVVEAIIKLVKK